VKAELAKWFPKQNNQTTGAGGKGKNAGKEAR
jgi:hypothetical protein